MKPDRAPNSIWCLNLSDLDISVRTEVDDLIVLAGPDCMGAQTSIFITRRQARLLAKRINQCLDATAKR